MMEEVDPRPSVHTVYSAINPLGDQYHPVLASGLVTVNCLMVCDVLCLLLPLGTEDVKS